MNLDRQRPAEHGLASLVAAAQEILTAVGRAVGDERVSSFPDARTLRYYQSLGVLDKPLRHEGREAVYGYRHLLQAVVTKLLQAEGYTLAQVQRALVGRSTEALEAAVVEALGGGSVDSVDPAAAERPTHEHHVLPPLLTREVAPGVIVTVDTRLVRDPLLVLDRITQFLTGGPR